MKVTIKSAALKDKEAIETMKNYEKFSKPRTMTFAFWPAADSGKAFPIKFVNKAVISVGKNSIIFAAQNDSFYATMPLDASIQFNENNEQIYVKSKLGTYLIEW